MIFDTHTHYDDTQFDDDREELLSRLREKNVGTVLNVGASLEGCGKSVELAETHPFIYAAVGVHPDETGALNETTFAWLRETAATSEKVIAIGEIGLDYHWNIQPREIQQRWFVRQMDLARELHLPVIIHSRDAAQDTFDLIAAHGQGLSGVLHCYSYSAEMAKEYVKRGFFIGIGGVLTFKNARKLKETAAEIPLDRILLETDCPYLAPAPFRGKRNDSTLIDYVAAELAAIKGLPKEEVIARTEENARKLFLTPDRQSPAQSS